MNTATMSAAAEFDEENSHCCNKPFKTVSMTLVLDRLYRSAIATQHHWKLA